MYVVDFLMSEGKNHPKNHELIKYYHNRYESSQV